MGSMMMSLNTHVLNSAPRELISRVTSLTNALQNVVGSLAIATFATVLQMRLPVIHRRHRFLQPFRSSWD